MAHIDTTVRSVSLLLDMNSDRILSALAILTALASVALFGFEYASGFMSAEAMVTTTSFL